MADHGINTIGFEGTTTSARSAPRCRGAAADADDLRFPSARAGPRRRTKSCRGGTRPRIGLACGLTAPPEQRHKSSLGAAMEKGRTHANCTGKTIYLCLPSCTQFGCCGRHRRVSRMRARIQSRRGSRTELHLERWVRLRRIGYKVWPAWYRPNRVGLDCATSSSPGVKRTSRCRWNNANESCCELFLPRSLLSVCSIFLCGASTAKGSCRWRDAFILRSRRRGRSGAAAVFTIPPKAFAAPYHEHT